MSQSVSPLHLERLPTEIRDTIIQQLIDECSEDCLVHSCDNGRSRDNGPAYDDGPSCNDGRSWNNDPFWKDGPSCDDGRSRGTSRTAWYTNNASLILAFSKQDVAYRALEALGRASPILRRDLIDFMAMRTTRLQELIRSKSSSLCVGGAEHRDVVHKAKSYMSGSDGLLCRCTSHMNEELINLLAFLLSFIRL